MDTIQAVAISALLALAFWRGKEREGILLYVMAGIAIIAYGLAWPGTYNSGTGMVFSIAMLGVGIYCLILAVFNIIARFKGG